MNKWTVLALALILSATPAMADIMTDNTAGDLLGITIYDGRGVGTGWNGAQEDNEVEPGSVAGQQWDFEAYFWNADTSTLYLVGGYDFKNGIVYNNKLYAAGDVFLFSDTNQYFLDMDRVGDVYTNLDIDGTGAGSYDIWQEGQAITYVSVSEGIHQGFDPIASDPYANDTTRDTLEYQDMTYNYYTITEAQANTLGLTGTGADHYVLEFAGLPDLDFGPGGSFYCTWTMLCGNDDGDGKIPVPEPATIGMAFAGLLGLALGRRKLRRHL